MTSNGRIASIDVLRGITIFMMVLSGAEAWNAGLPAWMFHAQVPPPAYVFDPSVKGISWVDLVFPFFIFSMGAAFPFALSRRMERGESFGSLVLGLVKRWLILAAFALVLGNAALMNGADCSDVTKVLVRLCIWAGMFLALWRVPKREGSGIPGWVINVTGAVVVAAMLLVMRLRFDCHLSFDNNDIIIMVLSTLAITGGLIWLLTRERHDIRWLLLVIAVALKELSWHSHCLDGLAIPGWLYWLFNWRYAQYLVISIFGSIIGDILLKASRAPEGFCPSVDRGRDWVSAFVCLAMVPAMLWAFFTRHIPAALAIALAGAAVFAWLLRGEGSARKRIALLGFAMLVAGIVFDPIDGGITKDHCNVSYMLSTGGLAALLTAFLLWCEAHADAHGRTLSRNFSMTGQNPMLAYTVSGFVISPFLYAIGLGVVDVWSEGHPLIGLARGLVVTLLMMALTCLFTKHKIFWRS